MSRAVITIFGSNRPERGSEAYEQAFELGRRLAQGGFTICNGGYDGTMAATAEGARGVGGEVIGVTVRPWGPPNGFVTQSVVHGDLLPRLKELVDRGDAHIALPGGTGTLLEIALVLEYQHKGTVDPRPLWFLGPQWSPVLRAAFVDQQPAEWIGGQSRIPDFKFFETPAEIAQAAEEYFP
jgi:uncharacterized protein (TIGR00725 family)